MMNNRLGYLRYAMLLVALGLIACGSSSSSSSSSAALSMSGFVMDGYLQGVQVCLDVNGNGQCDADEPSATTDSTGKFTLSVPKDLNLNTLMVLAAVNKGAIDSDASSAPVTSPYVLVAPASSATVVTPLTTLVQRYAAQHTVSVSVATQQVIAALGLPSTSNLFTDYIKTPDLKLHSMAQMITGVLQQNAGSSTSVDLLSVATTAAPAVLAAVAASGTTMPTASTLAQLGALAQNNQNLLAQINGVRAASGAGSLSLNPQLQSAAIKHVDYLVQNTSGTTGTTDPWALAHAETSGLPGFVAATPIARATAAGYTAADLLEEVSIGSASAADCVSTVTNSVYHLIELLSPWSDAGIDFQAASGSIPSVCALELAYTAAENPVYPAAGQYAFYPGSGQTNVQPVFYNQAEVPVPVADWSIAGQPVVVLLENRVNTVLQPTDVVLNAFSLTASGSSMSLPARILAATGVVGSSGVTINTDSNISDAGAVVLVPESPLTPNTLYTVVLKAQVKGMAVSLNWSFTTGAEN